LINRARPLDLARHGEGGALQHSENLLVAVLAKPRKPTLKGVEDGVGRGRQCFTGQGAAGFRPKKSDGDVENPRPAPSPG
jgi:hypothetical protein